MLNTTELLYKYVSPFNIYFKMSILKSFNLNVAMNHLGEGIQYIHISNLCTMNETAISNYNCRFRQTEDVTLMEAQTIL